MIGKEGMEEWRVKGFRIKAKMKINGGRFGELAGWGGGGGGQEGGVVKKDKYRIL